MNFEAFPKIPRLFPDCVITEKIDGTNDQIAISEDRQFLIDYSGAYLVHDGDISDKDLRSALLALGLDPENVETTKLSHPEDFE